MFMSDLNCDCLWVWGPPLEAIQSESLLGWCPLTVVSDDLLVISLVCYGPIALDGNQTTNRKSQVVIASRGGSIFLDPFLLILQFHQEPLVKRV